MRSPPRLLQRPTIPRHRASSVGRANCPSRKCDPAVVLRKSFISTEITYHCRTVDQVRRHQPIDTHDADQRVSISQVSVFPWIWFPSRRLPAISAQLDREYLVLRIDEGGRYCNGSPILEACA